MERLTYLKCLLRRISTTHELYPTIENDLQRIEAGIAGEQRVLRELQDIALDFDWLCNFSCISPQFTPHQMDFLVFSDRYAVVLEVKNIQGELHFQTVGQEFLRIKSDGKPELFRNPFDQAYRHKQLLEQLFKKWQIPIPVYYAVVISNTNTHIAESFGKLPIFHVTYLRQFLTNLTRELPRKHVNLSHLKRKLNKQTSIILPRKIISSEHISPGILCTNCNSLMQYAYGICICNACHSKSRTAIAETLRDYYYLINTTISNSEFRAFTMIDSIHTTSKILARQNMTKLGHGRNARYEIPPSIYTFPL